MEKYELNKTGAQVEEALNQVSNKLDKDNFGWAIADHTYNPTFNYSKGDTVYYVDEDSPYRGYLYMAKEDIAAPAGAFDYNKWEPTTVERLIWYKQDKIDTNNKLSSNLVDDTNATNKFITNDQATQISTNASNIIDLTNNKLNKDNFGWATAKKTYTTGTSYNLGEVVYYNGYLYRALEDIVSAPETFDWTKWTGIKIEELIDEKQGTLVSGTNIKTVGNKSILGSGDVGLVKADVGLGNVDNTSDVNKPISTAMQTALNAKQNTLTASTGIDINNNTIKAVGLECLTSAPTTANTDGYKFVILNESQEPENKLQGYIYLITEE